MFGNFIFQEERLMILKCAGMCVKFTISITYILSFALAFCYNKTFQKAPATTTSIEPRALSRSGNK